MSLRSEIVADADRVFLQSDDFAETVTYHPYRYATDSVRVEREIKAVVTRNQVSAFTPDGEVILPELEIRVANDATTGISRDEIDTGGDQIEVAVKVGGTAERRSIQYITESDEGMLVLICR